VYPPPFLNNEETRPCKLLGEFPLFILYMNWCFFFVHDLNWIEFCNMYW